METVIFGVVAKEAFQLLWPILQGDIIIVITEKNFSKLVIIPCFYLNSTENSLRKCPF